MNNSNINSWYDKVYEDKKLADGIAGENLSNKINEFKNAFETLKSSIIGVGRALKLKGNAKVDVTKAKITTVGNNVITSFENLQYQISVYKDKQFRKINNYKRKNDMEYALKEDDKATKVVKRIFTKEENDKQRDYEARVSKADRLQEKENARIRNKHKQDMIHALYEYDKEQITGRIINFKDNVIQKTNSFFSKLGTAKTNFVQHTRFYGNIDLKLKNAFETVQKMGINFASGLGFVKVTEDGVFHFSTSSKTKETKKTQKTEEPSVVYDLTVDDAMSKDSRTDKSSDNVFEAKKYNTLTNSWEKYLGQGPAGPIYGDPDFYSDDDVKIYNPGDDFGNKSHRR